MDQPNQFDDPNVIIANILGAIKSMSISIDASPNKLKQAYGDSVLSLLSVLAEKAVAASGFKYRVPTHKSEDFAEEAEVDKDAEVTADYIDEKINAFADDEDEVFHKDIVERYICLI